MNVVNINGGQSVDGTIIYIENYLTENMLEDLREKLMGVTGRITFSININNLNNTVIDEGDHYDATVTNNITDDVFNIKIEHDSDWQHRTDVINISYNIRWLFCNLDKMNTLAANYENCPVIGDITWKCWLDNKEEVLQNMKNVWITVNG